MNGRTNHRYRPSLNDARCVVMLSGPHSDRRERSREQPEAATVLPERGRCRCCSLVRARIAAGRVDRHRSPRHEQNTKHPGGKPSGSRCVRGTARNDERRPETAGARRYGSHRSVSSFLGSWQTGVSLRGKDRATVLRVLHATSHRKGFCCLASAW